MSNNIVCIIGLGYVGLPLAIAFSNKYKTIGYDLNSEAIQSYRQRVDINNEVDSKSFASANLLTFTDNPKHLSEPDFLIVPVPTPIDLVNQPDLRPLLEASTTAGQHIKREKLLFTSQQLLQG